MRVGLGSKSTLAQKASGITEVQTMSTTRDCKPIINTKDERHADVKLPRIHVTSGDANIAQWALWYTLTSTSAVLSLVERGDSLGHLAPNDPLRAWHTVNEDPSLEAAYETVDGRMITALDAQEEILTRIEKVVNKDTDNPEFEALVEEGARAIDDARADPALLADRVDWVAKRSIMKQWIERKDADESDPHVIERLEAISLLYADITSGFGVKLRKTGILRSMVSAADVQRLITAPPSDTRALKRGAWVKKNARFAKHGDIFINWDYWGFGSPSSRANFTYDNPYDTYEAVDS